MTRPRQIGFSQRVRLEWFEATARLVLAGNDHDAINRHLQGVLRDKVSVGGSAERGNREKIITILLKVWCTTPPVLNEFKRDGLDLLRHLSARDHLAIQWGMAMAVYPFWASVANQVGRLLTLQGSVAAAHVQRRVREQYGERETVSRATRRVLRSYVDWGVLRESGSKGVYVQGVSTKLDDPRVISWLMEASLRSRSSYAATLRDLEEDPVLFPFQCKRIAVNRLLSTSARLDYLRHGLDEGLLTLRK